MNKIYKKNTNNLVIKLLLNKRLKHSTSLIVLLLTKYTYQVNILTSKIVFCFGRLEDEVGEIQKEYDIAQKSVSYNNST